MTNKGFGGEWYAGALYNKVYLCEYETNGKKKKNIPSTPGEQQRRVSKDFPAKP